MKKNRAKQKAKETLLTITGIDKEKESIVDRFVSVFDVDGNGIGKNDNMQNTTDKNINKINKNKLLDFFMLILLTYNNKQRINKILYYIIFITKCIIAYII